MARLPSIGSHRVGHDWSNLAAAAARTRTNSSPPCQEWRFLPLTWPICFSLALPLQCWLVSSSWFFILPLTKIASLHPDVFQFLSSVPVGYWQYPLCPDRLHHTSGAVRKNTLLWPKEAKKLHRHLIDYITAQTRETRMDRTRTFYQGQVNAKNNNSVRRMFKRLPKENNYKKFWRGLKKHESWG